MCLYQQLSYLKRFFLQSRKILVSFPYDEHRSNMHGYRLFHRIDIRNQIQHFVGIAPLVVIPCDKLHEVVIEADAGARIKDGRSCVRDEVGGYDSVFGVADDALELFGFGSSLHSRFDFVVGSAFLKHAGEVYNRNVSSRYAERHAGKLAVQLRDNLADRFRSACGRRNDVERSAPAASPVFLRRTVNRLLGRRRGVYRRHQAFLDAELVVDNLRQRSQAVRRAGGVGTLTINRTNIQFLVFFRHRYHNRSDNRCRIPDKNIILRNKSPEPILTLLLLNFRVWEIRY